MKKVFYYAAALTFALLAAWHFAPQSSVQVPTPIGSPVMDCDGSLWNHVYHGHFASAQDRLHILKPCIVATGTIVGAVAEADGDWHIRVDVSDKSLLNNYNASGQHGYLVVEQVCANPVSQRDTVQEGVCNGFKLQYATSRIIFDPSMIGLKVSITGAWVVDMQHHWNEIHPVSSMTVLQ